MRPQGGVHGGALRNHREEKLYSPTRGRTFSFEKNLKKTCVKHEFLCRSVEKPV